MDPSRSGLRLTDAERDAAIARLGEHYAVGRLDKDEFDERSDAVWSARTHGQLTPVFADLERHPERVPHAAARRPASSRRRGFAVPWMPVLAVLVVLTVVTHLPFLLLALCVWCFVGHRSRHPGRSGRMRA